MRGDERKASEGVNYEWVDEPLPFAHADERFSELSEKVATSGTVQAA